MLGLAAAMLLIAAAGGARHFLATSPAAAPAAAPARARPVSPAKASPRRADAESKVAVATPSPGPRPASLRGTDEDGALGIDDAGELVVGPAVLAFFDYYLSATGEESDAAIQARIRAAIHDKHLPAAAAARAEGLLDRYLGYRQAVRSLSAEGSSDLGARLDALHRLRSEQFGSEDAARLFGAQERADRVALAEKQVREDPALSPAERDARVATLEEDLPEAVRAARAEATRPARLRAGEDELRASGADEAAVHAYRLASLGEDATARLDDLDRRRAEWRARVASFRAAREALSASDPRARDAAVAALLERSFTPEERLRVAALDSIDAP